MPAPRLSRKHFVYRDPFQQIYRVHADFGAFQKEYFVRDTGRRVGVVVIKDESVLLVQQYRLLINGLSWEIPGGRVDDGEGLRAAAMRECLEETGVRCRNLKPLISFHPGLDILRNPTHLFYTKDFIQSDRNHQDTHEVRNHAWMPMRRCLKRIFGRQIVDSLSIIGLLAYQKLIAARKMG